LAGLALTLSACQTGAGKEPPSRAAAVQVLADCLEASDLPVEVDKTDQQNPELTILGETSYLMGYGDGPGVGVQMAGDDNDYQIAWDTMQEGNTDSAGQVNQPVLFVGYEDRSGGFGQCLEQSGYAPTGIRDAISGP